MHRVFLWCAVHDYKLGGASPLGSREECRKYQRRVITAR